MRLDLSYDPAGGGGVGKGRLSLSIMAILTITTDAIRMANTQHRC